MYKSNPCRKAAVLKFMMMQSLFCALLPEKAAYPDWMCESCLTERSFFHIIKTELDKKELAMSTLVCQLIILFFVFSVVGWMIEVTLKYIQYHRFINRGFMIGPYCPIYGSGVVAITVCVGGLVGVTGSVGDTFLAGFVICGALEYFTSWYMEKLFHARWWDYSQKPMNLNGRVWIGNLILFGIASVAVVRLIDPVYFGLIANLSPFWLHLFAICIVVVMLTDFVTSHVLMNIVRREIDAQEGDNTEEISHRVHELLQNRSLLLRRIHEAYPELQARPRAMMERLHAAEKEFKAANHRFKALVREAAQAQKKEVGQKFTDSARPLEEARESLRAAKAKLHTMQQKLRRHDEDEL